RRAGRWLVAGSTWPADEDVIVRALARGVPWRAVIAPHEPDTEHIARLEQAVRAAGLRPLRLPDEAAAGAADFPPGDVVIVDRVGVLADLYAIADVAYVGG